LGEIGSGGFAEVHKVRHLIDQRIYAAKIVKIKPSFNREDTEERLYRILSEAKTLALLSHPNVLQFHGCWIELQTFTEDEKAELFENEAIAEDDFEMVMLNESYSSEGIVFGSSSKSKGETGTGELSKHERRCKIGDGSSLCDYK
jgi:serine/threonine protein kinase